MLLIEIQENIIKAQNALTHFESDTIYKGYKTLGGKVYILIKKWLFVKFGAKWQFLGYPKKT